MDYNAQFWKTKAVTRNLENKELKKRIKELKFSRDKWKGKYMKKKDESLVYKKELDSIKKKIEKIVLE